MSGPLRSLGWDAIPRRTRALLERNMRPDEVGLVCIVGTGGQTILALSDRVLVAKTGFMAGATFGGRCTTFPYEDLGGMQVNTGLVGGSIELQTSALGATKAGDYWTSDPQRDPWKLPNTIPVARAVIEANQLQLAVLAKLITDARHPAAPPAAPPQRADVADQLARLGELWAERKISDEEYLKAKAKVLGD